MNWRELITPKRVGILLIIILALLFSRQVATILFPFITGLILAALIEPVVIFLQRRARLPRPAAVMATLTAAVVTSGYLLFAVLTKMISELIDLANLLPQYRENIIYITNDLFLQFERLNESLPPVVSLNIQRSLEDFLKTFEIATRDLINRVLATFAGLPVFIAVTMVVIVSTYFIAKDKTLLADTLIKLAPSHWRNRIYNTKDRIAIDLIGFIKARLLLLLIASAIAGIGLILINTRYWMIIALVIGILDNIPVIGPGIIFTPWVAMTIILGDFDRAVYLTVLYLIIFAFRQLVEPKIMGDSVGIHPLAMLLALYAGIVIFGVIGIFVGPIILIVVKAALHAGLFKTTDLSSE